jgi:hypothetical protein
VSLGGGAGKFQKKFLKRIVMSGSGLVRSQLLFGSGQKASSTTSSTLHRPQVID